MSDEPSPLEQDFIAAATAARRNAQRRRLWLAVCVPVAVTVVWALYVTVAGHWGRVGQNWQASVTMVLASLVGGVTPQGSGAVAFPAFTKVLEVPSEVARTFALSAQAVGVGAAAVGILITRLLVEWRAVAVGGLATVLGFVLALVLLGDTGEPYWPSQVPPDFVRVTFTVVLAAMAWIVYLGTRVLIWKVDTALPPMNARLYTALVIAGLVGGVATGLTGSGADVMMYLFVVVLFGVDAKVGIRSAVIVMAIVSLLGLAMLGLADGQLHVGLSNDARQVIEVGGQSVTGVLIDGEVRAVFAGDVDAEVERIALVARRFDLFGMWLSIVPILAWGTPVGAYLAGRLRSRHLIYLAVTLAAIEIATTVVILEDLHRPSGLLAYAVAAMVLALCTVYLLARHRRWIFGLPGLSLQESLGRGSLDVAMGYERQLRGDRRDERSSGGDDVEDGA